MICVNCAHDEGTHPNHFLCELCRCRGWVKSAAGTKELEWVCKSIGQKKCSPEKQYSSHKGHCGYLS